MGFGSFLRKAGKTLLGAAGAAVDILPIPGGGIIGGAIDIAQAALGGNGGGSTPTRRPSVADLAGQGIGPFPSGTPAGGGAFGDALGGLGDALQSGGRIARNLPIPAAQGAGAIAQGAGALISGLGDRLRSSGSAAGGTGGGVTVGGTPTMFPGGGGMNKLMLPPIAGLQMQTIGKAPKGYVKVTLPVDMMGISAGSQIAMRRDVAIALKLFKPRAKPPISASDWKALKTARRVEKKAAQIAKTAGKHVYDEARVRKSSTTSKRR